MANLKEIVIIDLNGTPPVVGSTVQADTIFIHQLDDYLCDMYVSDNNGVVMSPSSQIQRFNTLAEANEAVIQSRRYVGKVVVVNGGVHAWLDGVLDSDLKPLINYVPGENNCIKQSVFTNRLNQWKINLKGTTTLTKVRRTPSSFIVLVADISNSNPQVEIEGTLDVKRDEVHTLSFKNYASNVISLEKLSIRNNEGDTDLPFNIIDGFVVAEIDFSVINKVNARLIITATESGKVGGTFGFGEIALTRGNDRKDYFPSVSDILNTSMAAFKLSASPVLPLVLNNVDKDYYTDSFTGVPEQVDGVYFSKVSIDASNSIIGGKILSVLNHNSSFAPTKFSEDIHVIGELIDGNNLVEFEFIGNVNGKIAIARII